MKRKALNPALAEAVRLSGGQSALAHKLGKRQGDVWSWLYRTGVVPTHFLLPIESAVSGRVTIRDLASASLAAEIEADSSVDEGRTA